MIEPRRRNPISLSIEGDVLFIGCKGLVRIMREYYGPDSSPDYEYPFTPDGTGDPLDDILYYGAEFGETAHKVIEEAARLAADELASATADSADVSTSFYLAARLAEISHDISSLNIIGEFLEDKAKFIPQDMDHERIAFRESFESLLRALVVRVESVNEGGGSTSRSQGGPGVMAFESICRYAMLRFEVQVDPRQIAADAPLFFLALAYDMNFQSFDELTVRIRINTRLAKMKATFGNLAGTSLARYDSSGGDAKGPYNLDAVKATWLAFQQFIDNTYTVVPVDPVGPRYAVHPGTMVSETGFNLPGSTPADILGDRLDVAN